MPAKRRKRRPNWPLRWTTLGFVALAVGIWSLSTWLSLYSDGRRQVFAQEQQAVAIGRAFEVFLGFWFFMVGGSIASFLNVVAYRLPRGIKITGFSRCPYCKVGIRGEDNIPVFGWLRLRGRCRACRLPISIRYPGFEVLGGLLFVAVSAIELLTHSANLPRANASNYLYGMLASQMDWDSLRITLTHLFLLTVLLASAMIYWGQQVPPLRLFGFGLIVGIALFVAWPELCVVTIQGKTIDPIIGDWQWEWEPRLESTSSYLVGCLAGCIWGAMSGQTISSGGKSSWMASFGLIGAFLGWQSVLSVATIALLTYIMVHGIKSMFGSDIKLNATAWLWLASLIHIASWNFQTHFSFWPHAKGLLIHAIWLIPLAALWLIVHRLDSLPSAEASQTIA